MNRKTLTGITVAVLAVSALLLAQDEPKSPPKDGMITKVYVVPPTFLSTGGGGRSQRGASDPFSDPIDGGRGVVGKRKSSKEILESAGITMPSGASAIYNAGTGQLIVRNTKDQHELVEAYLQSIVGGLEKQIIIIVEMIEVSHVEFSDWLLNNEMEGDSTAMRGAIQEWVRAGRGSILETVLVTARSGQRAKTESIREEIYPTEYDPAAVPESVTLAAGADPPITGMSPTAFETRNVGTTLEVDPVLGADDITIDLNLAPELVKLAGYSDWPTEEADIRFKARQPTFYTMKITTQVTLHKGRYVLLGTTRPLEPADSRNSNSIVLWFVRADLSTVGEKWSVEVVE